MKGFSVTLPAFTNTPTPLKDETDSSKGGGSIDTNQSLLGFNI